MADPKLKSVNVVIKYSSDDGFSCTAGYGGGPRNPHCKVPLEGLREAHRETARLLALFGHPEIAEAATADAVKAVADWRASRNAS